MWGSQKDLYQIVCGLDWKGVCPARIQRHMCICFHTLSLCLDGIFHPCNTIKADQTDAKSNSILIKVIVVETEILICDPAKSSQPILALYTTGRPWPRGTDTWTFWVSLSSHDLSNSLRSMDVNKLYSMFLLAINWKSAHVLCFLGIN